MKLISYLLLFISSIAGISAVDIQKSFLVSFDKAAPQSAIDEAKKMITDAKGVITHEYSLIKGFAATAGEKVFDSLQVYAQSNGGYVEEDQVVKLDGN